MVAPKSTKQSRQRLAVARAAERQKYISRVSAINNNTDQHVAERAEHDFRLAGLSAAGELQTVFHVREAQYEVEKRLAASRQPLHHKSRIDDSQTSYYSDVVGMPQRPAWHSSESADTIQQREQLYFNDEWIHNIYERYRPYELNHFEHNLDVWRQLWRTIESSDLLCICADVRHPQFHIPPSLIQYIEQQAHKPQIAIILNKIDLIHSSTLQQWKNYFKQHHPDIQIIPFTSYPHSNSPDGSINDSADGISSSNSATTKRSISKLHKRNTLRPLGTEELIHRFETLLQQKLSKRESNQQSDRSSHNSQHAPVASAPTATTSKFDDEADTAEPKFDSIDAELEAEDSAYKLKQAARLARRKQKKAVARKMKELRKLKIGDVLEDDIEEVKTDEVKQLFERRKQDSDDEVIDDSDEQSDASDSEADDIDRLPSWKKQTHLHTDRSQVVRIGFIGHPNAGKSSVLNAILNRHAASVSETPGKTKRLQTFNLTPGIELCDCPGLVFAAANMPKQLQVVAGLFPIPQLREPYSSVQYVAERIDLPTIYSLSPPTDDDASNSSAPNKASRAASSQKKAMNGGGAGIDSDDLFAALDDATATYSWSAWDICEAYARKHNMRVGGSKGRYDTHGAALKILQDTTNGAVVLNFEPPR